MPVSAFTRALAKNLPFSSVREAVFALEGAIAAKMGLQCPLAAASCHRACLLHPILQSQT